MPLHVGEITPQGRALRLWHQFVPLRQRLDLRHRLGGAEAQRDNLLRPNGECVSWPAAQRLPPAADEVSMTVTAMISAETEATGT